jgi:hypothetical protein
MVPCLKTEAKLASETSRFIKKLDDERTPRNENIISELQRGFIFCMLQPVALLYRHVTLQPRYFTATLLYSHVTLQPRYFTTALLYSNVTLQPRYFTATLLYSHVTLQPRYFTAALLYSHVTLQPRYFTATTLNF